MADGILYVSSHNADINLKGIETENDVNSLAQALLLREDIKTLVFAFRDHQNAIRGPPAAEMLSFNFWEPMLRALEAFQDLEEIRIFGPVAERLIPLFRDHLFQALRRSNASFRSFHFGTVDFTDNSEGILSYLEAESSLTSLTLLNCVDSSIESRNLAVALQHNTKIQKLNLESSFNGERLTCSILQKLASSESTAGLKQLVFNLESDTPSSLAAQALRQLLESNHSKLSSVGLRWDYASGYNEIPGFSTIVQGVIRSESVHEVEFIDLFVDDNGEAAEEVLDQTFGHFSNIVRFKSNLSSLKISEAFFEHASQLLDAMAEVIVRHDSPLRRLDITFPAFRDLRTAISRSTRLESLAIKSFSRPVAENDRQALMEYLPFLKVTDVTLEFSEEWRDEEKELLLGALKRNYIFQSIQCTRSESEANWFDEAGQARLKFYADRNRKLAQWIRNPKLVPQDLWPLAMKLAVAAGLDSLYQSLLALSGHGIGCSSRKRKRSSLS